MQTWLHLKDGFTAAYKGHDIAHDPRTRLCQEISLTVKPDLGSLMPIVPQCGANGFNYLNYGSAKPLTSGQ